MVLFLFVLLTCSSAHSASDTSIESIVSIRDRYMAAARISGLQLGFVPEMKEWTRPSMISWRAEAKAVAIPKWEELSKDQKALITEMAGATAKSEKLFSLLFRWFLVPHELTHAYQDQMSVKMRPSEKERFANDVAAAILYQDNENHDRLAELGKFMKAADRNLRKLSLEKLSDEFFDTYYQQLPKNNTLLYGRYQIKFILDSLKRQNSLDLSKLFSQLKNSGK